MNLTKESLEILSNCILSKMEELSRIKYVSQELLNSINKEIKTLQELHTKVCEAMKVNH